MQDLPSYFKGSGIYFRTTFYRIDANARAYLYSATKDLTGERVYHVFKRNEGDGFVKYPTPYDFGKWAQSFKTRDEADRYFNTL